MKIMDKKPTFGLIVGTRGFFNPELAVQGRRDLLVKLDKLGYSYVIPPEDATPNGAIETLADAKVCAKLFKIVPEPPVKVQVPVSVAGLSKIALICVESSHKLG